MITLGTKAERGMMLTLNRSEIVACRASVRVVFSDRRSKNPIVAVGE
jgi:hypothetical protein